MNELDEAAAGRGDLLSQAQSDHILARFAPRNERLRSRWFPERATLFAEDATADTQRADSAELLQRFDQLFRGEGGKD
ncbi:hypothetical protein [Paracoccus sp. PAR01]|uniref:hypothetical protein n=1 Tax=Paracoccus sp. PAR01 TaxID=2769282 RepID=UPI00178100DB|nr:hypothetical protein [Paracoccus sp. PAR01]MBD9526431.1 hypothetical protein [Paracoccus sp. PAR01]